MAARMVRTCAMLTDVDVYACSLRAESDILEVLGMSLS